MLLLGPYVLLLAVFFAAPLALMLALSVSHQGFGQMGDRASSAHSWVTLHHYMRFFSDSYYVGVLWDTLHTGPVPYRLSVHA